MATSGVTEEGAERTVGLSLSDKPSWRSPRNPLRLSRDAPDSLSSERRPGAVAGRTAEEHLKSVPERVPGTVR